MARKGPQPWKVSGVRVAVRTRVEGSHDDDQRHDRNVVHHGRVVFWFSFFLFLFSFSALLTVEPGQPVMIHER